MTNTKIKFYIILMQKKILGWIIKISWKWALLLFLYEMCIAGLIDFIAILLTPGIFLIQIVNKNMYLIHFYIKNNIEMHFPKVGFLKFQIRIRHSLSIGMLWNKLCWHQQRLHNNAAEPDFKKNIIIYIVQNFDRFLDKMSKIVVKNKRKSKFKIWLLTAVVHTILSIIFFLTSEINIEWLMWFLVRPT